MSGQTFGGAGIIGRRCLEWAVATAMIIYSAALALYGAGSDEIMHARSFGLFALFGTAQQLARWRHGSKSGLLWAMVITFVIGASQSRLALGIAIFLFPLSQVPTRGLRRFFKVGAIIIAAVGLSYASFFYFDGLRERFLTGDVSMKIGGITINASGRTAFWRLTEDSIREAPIVGHGAGSAEGLIESFYGDIRHPHNDYLRLFHDYGLIGLTLWFLVFALALVPLWRHWRLLDGLSRSHAKLQLTALLALVGFALQMTAENAIVYVFITGPLGLLVGSALGSQRATLSLAHIRGNVLPR